MEKNFSTDSWETIVAAVQQAETNGTEYPYNVGDEKAIEMDIDGNGTAEEYTIRIANKTKCSALDAQNKTVISKTACGFVLEFKDVIKKMKMRDTLTNAGGWPATNVRTYLNNENDETSLYNLLPTELSGGIINTYVVSGRGKYDTSGNLDDDNFGYDDKIYLLSTYEVWGSNPGKYDLAATDTITRQLDYYADNEVTTRDYGDAIKNYHSINDENLTESEMLDFLYFDFHTIEKNVLDIADFLITKNQENIVSIMEEKLIETREFKKEDLQQLVETENLFNDEEDV